MSFLNVALLLGAAAFVVPLWIHLLNRSRFKTVDWGATHLLVLVEAESRRSLDWQSWLLLALRCAIPILFAAALARPFFTSPARTYAFGNDAKRMALAIVIDDSFSMASKGMRSDSIGNECRSSILEILENVGDAEVFIVCTSDPNSARTSLSTLDSVVATNHVRNLQFDAGCCNPMEAINAARNWLTQASASNRQMIIASDWQTSSWQSILRSTDQARAQEESMPELGSSTKSVTPMATSFLRTPEPKPTTPNVSIRFQEAVNQTANGRIELPIDIKNWSAAKLEAIQFRCSIDDRVIHQEVISLSAGEDFRRRISVRVENLGFHSAYCEVEVPDSLGADNSAFHSFISSDPNHVLIVRSRQLRKSQTDYLATALAPFGAASDEHEFRISIESANALARTLRSRAGQNLAPTPFDCIVLQGVKQLEENAAELLKAFVAGGGGLVVLPSASCDLDWYQRVLCEELSILPSAYRPITKTDGLRIAARPISGGRLEALNPVISELNKIRFDQLIPLGSGIELQETDLPKHEFIRFEDQAPFFALSRFGKGAVGQLCIPLDASLSQTHLSPAMVPLVQQLVRSTLATPIETTVHAGDSYSIDPANSKLLGLRSDALSESLEVTLLRNRTSVGQRIEVAIASDKSSNEDIGVTDSVLLAIDDTVRPGLYGFTSSTGTLEVANPGATTGKIGFAVQSPRGESDLKRLSLTELESLAAEWNGRIIGSAKEFVSGIQTGGGQEIWRALVLGLLAVLFLESWLAGRISGGPRSAT
ncbi:MAG: BatA domain-containing protein [Aureliella sp.]